MMRFTVEQERAIELQPGNLLVSAAAGSGKTAVLVERVLRRLTDRDDPVDVDQVLVVTFTEAAAEEMKSRIRKSLEDHLAGNPGDDRLRRQLWLLDRADISTIHSFCLRTVRQHFHKLGLDPGFTVLDEHEADLLKSDVLEELLEECYSGFEEGANAEAGDLAQSPPDYFLRVVEWFGGKRGDGALSALILRFHTFLASLPEPEEWLRTYVAALDVPQGGTADDTGWGKMVRERALFAVEAATELLRKALCYAGKPDGPGIYAEALREDLAGLENLLRSLRSGSWDEVASVLEELSFRDLPRRQRGDSLSARRAEIVKGYRNKAKGIVQNLKDSVLSRRSLELLGEMRVAFPLVRELSRLVCEFDRRYRRTKFRRRGLDFSDLERYCLELLRSEPEGDTIRSKYREIFVDEYQDINPIQDAIIELVRGSAGDRKLFMVGDYRQSIYAFRLAEPGIFLSKYRAYPREHLPDRNELLTDLTVNFRSRREILDTVNTIFKLIMRDDVAGMNHGRDEELRCGRKTVPAPGGDGGCDFRVEIHLVERDVGESPDEEGEDNEERTDYALREAPPGDSGVADAAVAELEALEKEALVIAQRIREITSEPGLEIWDESLGAYRRCAFRDIVILMRATRNRCEPVLEVLRRAGIPVYSDAETGYFAAREVETALSLLSIIDNPVQDIPLAAVLRSPVVGLSGEDLARIRLACPVGRFFHAVEKAASRPELGDLALTLRSFLEKLDRWRTMARRMPLSDLIWHLLRETGYLDYVSGMPGGAQRRANLVALYNRAREFDSFHRRGLFRFLRFIVRLQESEGDLGQARVLGEAENVVRVMSVHKAKGLEFPVVFVMDLGRQFDFKDAREDVLFHRSLGIGPVMVDTEAGVKYPTLAHAAVSFAVVRESMAEEMRILYVAMTRAREKLFLVGSARKLRENVRRWVDEGLSSWSIASARTYLDWVVPALLQGAGAAEDGEKAVAADLLDSPLWTVRLWREDGLPLPVPSSGAGGEREETGVLWEKITRLEGPDLPPDPEIVQEVERRMEWRYPLLHLTVAPAKVTVGELAARLHPEEERWTEVLREPLRESFPPKAGQERDGPAPPEEEGDTRTRGVMRGIAVHRLLGQMNLELEPGEAAVAAEVERLVGAGILSSEEASLIDRTMILDFLKSPLGSYLRTHRNTVRREVPFTVRIPAELFRSQPALPEDEEVQILRPEALGPGHAESAYATGRNEGGGNSGYVVLQGSIDVMMAADGGLEIVDYKTDRTPKEGLGTLVERYTPQVSWYAFAAETILGRPVIRARIAFLEAREERDIPFREFLTRMRLPFPEHRG